MIARVLNFKAIVTVLLGVAYIGPLILSLLDGRLDPQSYIAGIGPVFGMAIGYWFRDDAKELP